MPDEGVFLLVARFPSTLIFTKCMRPAREQVGVDERFQIRLAKKSGENDSIGRVKRPIRYRRHLHLKHSIAFLSDNLPYVGDSLQASANRWALQDGEG